MDDPIREGAFFFLNSSTSMFMSILNSELLLYCDDVACSKVTIPVLFCAMLCPLLQATNETMSLQCNHLIHDQQKCTKMRKANFRRGASRDIFALQKIISTGSRYNIRYVIIAKSILLLYILYKSVILSFHSSYYQL